MGVPVIAFTMTFSYPQSFPGPVAPDSTAVRVLAADMHLATAANVFCTSLSMKPPAMNMAMFELAQLVSPPGTVLFFLQMSVNCVHRWFTSNDPRYPEPNRYAVMSPCVMA